MIRFNIIYGVTAVFALAWMSCDGSDNADPTVFRGEVIWADDGSPVPNAIILYDGVQRVNFASASRLTVIDDTISVDEFGAFDFTVPGEVDSRNVDLVGIGVAVGSVTREDSLYGMPDFVFPDHITERIGLKDAFPAGEIYELTIGLPR